MRFIIPVNVPEENGSQTMYVVDTESNCRRTNRRKLREVLSACGIPNQQLKHVMKKMGFVGEALGNSTTISATSVPRER